MKQAKMALELGRLVATPGALEKIPQEEINAALARHHLCDWGDVSKNDKKANDEDARNGGGSIVSAYHSKDGTKFWVITEWDRSVTTVLLPEEY
jgi:hypothetical protein